MAAASGKDKQFKAGLPILGLILAIALAALSFGIAKAGVPIIEEQKPSVEQQFNDLRNEFEADSFLHENIVELVFAGMIWLALMAVSMFVVSASMLGTSPDKEVWEHLPVSPADKKGMIKQMKRDLRDAKKKARTQKRQKKS
jgi:hypothetical protein